MNPRIKDVTPTENFKLMLLFSNGERGLYDCSGLLNFGVFKELQDRNYFNQVKVLGTWQKLKYQDCAGDFLSFEVVTLVA